MNISVLRTVFDKLAGQALTRHFVTPKRPKALPEILSHNETRALLAAADTTRDQLLLGLLYGCGLKLSELRNLTWSAVDAGRLHLPGREARTLQIPHELVPVLDYGKSRCLPADHIFQGRFGVAPLSARMIELTIRRARNAAGILKPVTAMTLRHTYAVHCLENGESIRELQQALGHQHVKTTMQYTRCILPPNLESPLDPIKRQQRRERPESADCRPQTEQLAPASPFQLSAFSVSAFTPLSPSSLRSQVSSLIPFPDPSAPLFAHPITVQPLDLPFTEPSAEPSTRFYRLLKTLISGRFLSRRRSRSG